MHPFFIFGIPAGVLHIQVCMNQMDRCWQRIQLEPFFKEIQ